MEFINEQAGTYNLSIVPCTAIYKMTAGLTRQKCSSSVQVSGGAASDPVITGFDGQSFHFDQTGNFTLLSSGDGFKASRQIGSL